MQTIKAMLPASTKKAVKRAVWPVRVLTARWRMPPDFIIIGAQKGGTTSLYNYLYRHPCIRPALDKKEVSFFNVHYGKGAAWYRAHFPLFAQRAYARRVLQEALIAGEATPDYLVDPRLARRVFALAPQVRLIALLRDPVARAYSGYHHERGKGREPLTFEEAIAAEEERLAGELDRMRADERYYSWPLRHQSYLYRGVYVDQLRAWIDVFPEEQFLILKSEDFYADPSAILDRVIAFLGLPTEAPRPWKPEQYKKYLENVYEDMAPATRKRLTDYFAPHNRRLYEFLGVDFGWDV